MNKIARAGAVPLFQELECTISGDAQDKHFMLLLAIDGHRVRVRIRRNCYIFQSHAVAEIWAKDALRWNEVATVPHTAMETAASVLHARGDLREFFRADSEKLLRQVAAILI
jgi:hypothetical protein